MLAVLILLASPAWADGGVWKTESRVSDPDAQRYGMKSTCESDTPENEPCHDVSGFKYPRMFGTAVGENTERADQVAAAEKAERDAIAAKESRRQAAIARLCQSLLPDSRDAGRALNGGDCP